MRTENIGLTTAARLEDVFDELRHSIFAAYRALADRDRDHEATMAAAGGLRRLSEEERRQGALEFIDETLDGHALASFSAVHLELLELMVAYWREAEVEAGAASPDPV